MEYKKLVDEVNEDKSLFKWFSQEEEREMYEETLIRQSKEAGLIEGKKSGIISVAKNMIAEGMSIDLISKLTKLNKSQINRLL